MAHAKLTHASKCMKSKHAVPPPENQLARVSAEGLVRNIKKCLDVPFETLARYAGPSYSTLGNWAGGSHATQVEALLRLLARLPASDRHRLVDEACPVFPSLAHPYLARDRVVVSQLSGLLKKTRGVTLVQGDSAYLRAWLLTALGHSLGSASAGTARVAGLDLSEPDWCVPVAGVTYLNSHGSTPPRLDSSIFQEVDLFLCQGAYDRWPGLRLEIQKATATTHVVVGEARFSPRELERFRPPRHVIRVGIDGRYAQRTDDAAYMLIRIEESIG